MFYHQLIPCLLHAVCLYPPCAVLWRIRFQHELKIISQQYPFEPIKYLRPSLRITFQEGIAMLRVSEYETEGVRASACDCILLLYSKPLHITVPSIISTSSYHIPSCPVISCPIHPVISFTQVPFILYVANSIAPRKLKILKIMLKHK